MKKLIILKTLKLLGIASVIMIILLWGWICIRSTNALNKFESSQGQTTLILYTNVTDSIITNNVYTTNIIYTTNVVYKTNVTTSTVTNVIFTIVKTNVIEVPVTKTNTSAPLTRASFIRPIGMTRAQYDECVKRLRIFNRTTLLYEKYGVTNYNQGK